MIKRFFAFWLAALLALSLCAPAAAEDCFTIDVDVLDIDRLNSDDYVARELSASTQGVRVRKYISDSSELAAPVRLTLTQMDSRMVFFDRDYGFQSGTFDSGVIYLPYVDDRTIPYLVTLYIGDYVYAMPFMHLQPRLQNNGACTEGVRLRDLDPAVGNDWLMGTMVDLNAGSQTVNVIASNEYVIGRADIAVSGGSLRVDLSFDPSASVEVRDWSLYVITDCAAYARGQRFPAYSVGEWIDVSGCETALVYLPMQVSYDPSGLSAFSYDLSQNSLQRQLRLWQECAGANSGASEASGWGGGSDWGNASGWADGWSEGSGWDDDWSGGADGWLDSGW